MRKKLLAVALLVAGVFLVAPGREVSASCYRAQNSDLYEIEGDLVCAYTGGGCDVCFTQGPRGDGSWNLCYYSVQSGDWHCIYYN